MGIALNATYDSDGPVIYEHACALACEGIVSKRAGSLYRAGRTDQWLKMKTHLHQPSVVIAKSTGRSVDVPTGSRSLRSAAAVS
jgi:ATP-dependent DNA ligase